MLLYLDPWKKEGLLWLVRLMCRVSIRIGGWGMSLEEDCSASFCWGLSPLPLVVLMGTASQGTLEAWSA